MRLLFLTENYPPRRGGMSQACDRIVMNLRKENIEVDVAFFCQSMRFKTIQQQNGKLFSIPLTEGAGHSLNCFWNLINSSDHANSYTHIIAFGGLVGLLALPVFKAWMKCKAICMLRGNDLDLGLFNANRRQILLDAVSAADAVSVLSSDQIFKLKPFVAQKKLFKIPNGINLYDWQTDETDLNTAQQWRKKNVGQNRLVIGLIGQLKSKKGGKFLISNMLSAKLNENFHLLLIGDLKEDFKLWLDEKKERLNYTALPFLDRWELLSWYPACDFVALPSFYDGMPNVLLEAGALSIPILAAKAGGIPDIMTNSSAGITFYPGDRHDCRRALLNCARSTKETREKMGKKMSKRIKTHFNSIKETKNYVNLLRKFS